MLSTDERGGDPPILFAYRRDFSSANPRAPEIPKRLLRALQSHNSATEPPVWPDGHIEVVVRMPPWTEHCAVILAHGTTVPGWVGSVLPVTSVWLTPLVVVFVTMLLAVGPILRRIRRLSQAVQRSAEVGFAQDVRIPGNDEIADLSRAFDAAADQVRARIADSEHRERILREFVANTTHDVMIPLTVLKHHLASMEERAAKGEPTTDVVRAAMGETHYIGALFSNLATAAKLEGAERRLERGRVDLVDLLGRVLTRHQALARPLGISIESTYPPDPLEVDADMTLLEQAISNVVHNAVRYNQKGGHVALILERQPPDQFSLRIVDGGPGVPREDLDRIIARGARGNTARTRNTPGQGLGLHIAYRVAELHGYTLKLCPSEFGGLQVDFTGPADSA